MCVFKNTTVVLSQEINSLRKLLQHVREDENSSLKLETTLPS